MAYDGFITKSICYELNKTIIGGKINKVFEPNKNEIILGIYANSKNYALEICVDSSNLRLHLTTHSKPNPYNAPNFCMLLRKYLIGMKIKKFESFDLERIVFIELEGFNELNDIVNRKLVIELMGKHSNIILLNEKNIIIDSLRHLDISSNSLRDILPAHPYTLPTSTKKSFINISNFDDFYSTFSDKNIKDIKDISTIISDIYTGISKNFILFIINKLNLTNCNISSYQQIYLYLKNILENLSTNNISITTFETEKHSKDYALTADKKNDLDINFIIDDFYFDKEQKDNFKNYKKTLLQLILNNLNKYKKKLLQIDNKIKECSKMDKYKLYGELLTSNLYRINNDNNIDFIELENYYDNNNIIKIPLDKSKTPSHNATLYFKKYNKLKSTLEYISEEKKQVLSDLEYIESIIYELDSSNSISDLDEIYLEISETILVKDRSYNAKKVNVKKKNSRKKVKDTTWVPTIYNVEGYEVYVGRNNKQNDYLTTKFAKPNDIWFHTQDIHGSHVILKNTSSGMPPIEILEKCASIAAFYSKAKSSSNVPVDYTQIKYVKKPNSAKPGMVIFKNQKTLFVNPKI